MTSKSILRSLMMLLAFGMVHSAFGQNKKKDRPNIIFIMTDDQGTIDLNCYGAKDLYTPNLDKMAGEGTRFTQFYASASVCSPSRAALMTGKTNLRAGLRGNVPNHYYNEKLNKYGMPTEQVTMPEMLKRSGYRTALIGKWHLGNRPETLPNGQGFDYFFGHRGGCIDNYSHFMYWQGPNHHDLYRNEEEVYYNGSYFPDMMVSEVKDIIQEESEDPFFIYWAFNAPHYPYQGDQEWMEYYKDLPTPRREYAAFISSIDERVGQVMEELKKQGKDENTIVIFQSDHGHSTEERAHWGGGNSGGYRGSKFSYFEGGIRVPAIIRYPGVVPEGQVRDQMAIEWDWFATLAELTGTEIEDLNIDGKSLMPVIKKSKAKSQHDVLYWQHGSEDDNKAQWVVRKGDWKLYGNTRDAALTKEWSEKLWLTNLKKDRTESSNLLEEYPEVVEELQKLHDEWLADIHREMNYGIHAKN